MGRKRATFPDGIAEEEQQYAQVLRDIRDLRGETLPALSRQLDWSVSTISRFEAAAERPDEATHRRYCALAPTEELRQRAVAAYEAESRSARPAARMWAVQRRAERASRPAQRQAERAGRQERARTERAERPDRPHHPAGYRDER
jgi:transcriptional regulator with XRE-family HTH domain